MDSELHFPIFRKLENGKSLYRINSLNSFDEVQFVGSKIRFYHIEAVQYPEKLRILDMIDLASPYITMDENEFLAHE